MKVITKSAVLAAMFFGTFVASARAEDILTVKIPFPFMVDHREHPAGRYLIRASDDSADVIWIEGMNTKSAAVALTIRTDGRDPAGTQPALVFTRSGNGYQLSQIWESDRDGRELSRLPGVRHVGPAETQSGAPETVTISAEAK
jgi:hypothetical protein